MRVTNRRRDTRVRRRLHQNLEIDEAVYLFFFQAEDGIRYLTVTGVQTCALPIYSAPFVPGFRHLGAEPPCVGGLKRNAEFRFRVALGEYCIQQGVSAEFAAARHLQDLLPVGQLHDSYRVELGVDHRHDAVAICGCEIPVERGVEVVKSVLHPAAEGHRVKHDSPGTRDFVTGLEKLEYIEDMLTRSAVDEHLELLLDRNRIVEIDLECRRRAVEINGDDSAVVEQNAIEESCQVPAPGRRLAAQGRRQLGVKLRAQFQVLSQLVDRVREGFGWNIAVPLRFAELEHAGS